MSNGLTVDFSGVSDGDGFDPLPDGTYNCNVFDVTVEETKAKDGHYLNWQLKITDDGYNNRRVFYNTSLKPQALWKLKQVLNRIAPDMDWGEEFNVGEIIDSIVGLPCRAVISYNDEYDNNNVDDVLAPGESVDEDAEDLPI